MPDKHKEDQAAKLEQLFREVSNPELNQTSNEETEAEDFVEVDVLQLPPRSEVHQKSKMSIHFTFRSPVARLILVIILLIAVVALLYGFFGNEIVEFFTEQANEEQWVETAFLNYRTFD